MLQKIKWFVVLVPLVVMLVFAVTSPPSHAWTFNGGGQLSGSATATASPTPYAVGSTTPVAVSTCAAATNPRFYMDFQVSGGTLNTDGCFIQPAAAASPCAAANPAPNSSTKFGYWAPTGGTGWQHTTLNWLEAGGGNVFNSEWDAVCTTALSVSVTTVP